MFGDDESYDRDGDGRVDAALARFDELTGLAVADHVEVFEDVQRRLQDVLSSIDRDSIDRDEGSGPSSDEAPVSAEQETR